jgi:6-phosphogluconolactonase
MTAATSVSLVVAASKDEVSSRLNEVIVPLCAAAIQARGIFTVALSGGSLPSFLSAIQAEFDIQKVDPKFESWHILLADERCVPSTDADSNLGALQKSFLSRVSIPDSQIYGISEEKLKESTEAAAIDYELRLREVLSRSGGQLDLAVLGTLNLDASQVTTSGALAKFSHLSSPQDSVPMVIRALSFQATIY